MNTKATVSISLVYALLHYAANFGIDPSQACQAAQLQLPVNNNPGTRISSGQFYALWTEIIHQAGDPEFGLHFAALSRNQPRGGVLHAVMFNCPTLGEAMEKLARYHDLATDFIKIHIQDKDEFVHYAWEAPIEERLDRHISEAVIGWIFFILQGLSDQHISIREVRFQHLEPVNTLEHQKIFGSKIKFEQPRNEIIIGQDVHNFPIPLADPRVLQHLEAILQDQLDELYTSDTWSERVSHCISQILLQGEQPSIAAAADEVALSTRQLQNKLRAEGTSYRVLYERVRKEMALRYLKEPDINLYDIAFLLGFSDQSAFNHAFKRWTGTTPRKYQK